MWGWLSDVSVNAGQQLIQQAHPHVHELQDVTLGQPWHVCMCETARTYMYVHCMYVCSYRMALGTL